MNTLAIYGALRGSRALGSHIDERVVKHVAQLLTSNNARDLDKGIKLISKQDPVQSDPECGCGGRRGWNAGRGVRGDRQRRGVRESP